MDTGDLKALRDAAEVLDDHGYEILAEQVWYVFEQKGGVRS